MTFAAPLNLLWLLPAFGAIVALYLLRRPRRNLVVPSTQLWRLLPAQPVLATRMQRFTPQALFFLQLLIALLLVGAAAQPELRRPARAGIAWALVVDNGASMNADDVPDTRLVAAKSAAISLLRGDIAPNDTIFLLTTAPARIVSGQTGATQTASSAISAIQATDAYSDIAGAVALAAAALQRTPNRAAPRRVVLLTDDAWPASLDSAVSKAAGGLPLALERVGTASAQNTGITRLSVQRDASEPGRFTQILTEVSAFGASGGGRLSLDVAGRSVASERIDARPGAPAILVSRISSPAQSEVLTARFTPNGRDDLAGDNTAYAVLPAAGSIRALLVSSGDPPLERALGLLPGVLVDETSPARYASVGAPAGYDVYVFDGVQPPKIAALPGSVLVWGGAAREFAPGRAASTDTSQVVDWDRSDPVLRFADLSQARINAPAWQSVGSWQPLMETQNGIVAAAQEIGARRAVWFSFQPQASGFAAQTAFPIVVSNAIGWLAQSAGQSEPAGAPISLAPVAGGWTVTGPDGRLSSGVCDERDSPCSMTDTFTAGIYTARSGNETLLFARNVDPSGSDIVPKPHKLPGADMRQNLTLGGWKRIIWTDIAGWVAALCLAALLGEWWLYHRKRRQLRPSAKVVG